MTSGSFSFKVRADEIPVDGRHFRIEANEVERRSLAEQLDIPEVTELAADIDVRPLGGSTFSVTGTLTATVVQTDIVTLEPVRQAVNEAIELTLAAAEDIQPDASADSEESESPELYHGGRIELGALAGEHLALGLDPYPRAQGVEFTGHIEDDSAEESPFAVLAKLKKAEE